MPSRARSNRRVGRSVTTAVSTGSARRVTPTVLDQDAGRRSVGCGVVDQADLALLVAAGRVRAVPRRPRLQQGVRRRGARRHGALVRVDRDALAGRAGPPRRRRPRSAPGSCSPLGLLTPLAAAGMIGVMFVASYAAHRGNFFVFKDGWEYSVIDRRRRLGRRDDRPRRVSLDHAIGLDWTAWDGWIGAVIAGVVGLGGGRRPARHLLPPAADGRRPP